MAYLKNVQLPSRDTEKFYDQNPNIKKANANWRRKRFWKYFHAKPGNLRWYLVIGVILWDINSHHPVQSLTTWQAIRGTFWAGALLALLISMIREDYLYWKGKDEASESEQDNNSANQLCAGQRPDSPRS